MANEYIPDDHHRLSDGRNDLGDKFANPDYAGEQALANSFADPNSLDDARLGKSFEETNSSAKKRHKPVLETVEAPFKKTGSKKVILIVVACVVCAMLIALIAGLIPRHRDSKETAARAHDIASAEPVVQGVHVEYAKEGAGLTLPGTTTPLMDAPVYARAAGYLKKRYVDIGDHVRKGQLMAVIDAPELDQQVDQAREQLRQAEAQEAQQETQLALTKVTVDRYRALVAKGVFSRQDGDQQETNYQAQRANVASADRNVEAFRANLRRAIALQSFERVTAPFDGVVTQRNVDEGAYISSSGAGGSSAPTPMQTPGVLNGSSQTAGQTNTSGSSGSPNMLANPTTGGASGGPLFAVSQVQRLRILISVPEGYASMVAPGQRASLHFQEFPDQEFYGDVTRTAASIDQNTRTMLTEVQVDNHAGHLLSGMYAVVTFAPRPQSSPGATANASTENYPIVISGDAVAIRDNRPTVAVIDGSGLVHLQPVVLGRDFGAEIEIMSGLKPGQVVADSFTDEITNGARVKVKIDQKADAKANPVEPPKQNTPPGGSTQYGDPSLENANLQGQTGKSAAKNGKKGKAPQGQGGKQ